MNDLILITMILSIAIVLILILGFLIRYFINNHKSRISINHYDITDYFNSNNNN